MFVIETIFGALVTFLLVTVAGNWLIQAWQHRNWVNQQRFLGKEREFVALRELFEEIAGLAGRRITRMRRLLVILRRPDDELVRRRLEDYDEVQSEWNDRLNTFYARLKLYLEGYEMVTRLEEGIQKRFVTIGSQLEFAVRERLQGNLPGMAAIAGLRQQLNAAMGVIDDFNRDMLRLVEDVKKETYFGIEFDLSPRTLERFSTLELIQALFKKRMQTYSVIRTTADLGEPKRGRY